MPLIARPLPPIFLESMLLLLGSASAMENCRAIIPQNPLFLLLFLSFLCLPLCEAICYYPDGETIAPQDVPCQNGPGDSVCCGPGYACLSNGLCMGNNATHDGHSLVPYGRGSCTDKRWRSSACPAFCIGPKGRLRVPERLVLTKIQR